MCILYYKVAKTVHTYIVLGTNTKHKQTKNIRKVCASYGTHFILIKLVLVQCTYYRNSLNIKIFPKILKYFLYFTHIIHQTFYWSSEKT